MRNFLRAAFWERPPVSRLDAISFVQIGVFLGAPWMGAVALIFLVLYR